MAKSGFVEFQNHTYDLHSTKGGGWELRRVNGESQEDYEALLREDLGTMQKRMEEYLGQEPPSVLHIHSALSVRENLRLFSEMGFRCTLTCESRMKRDRQRIRKAFMIWGGICVPRPIQQRAFSKGY